ncbi:MAG: hypothetical protein JWR77_1324 [Rhizorhabdus sp.]|nr:hypothetical protein [Rhizorhabdus sp.]
MRSSVVTDLGGAGSLGWYFRGIVRVAIVMILMSIGGTVSDYVTTAI